ncbi:SRPBCC family protein [Gorillibacterium timonense]|uniref:SRPBCC family protein n=1 Tax=Gorillibacterium timonense TaxID=1689269 RepID=UPI00071D4366|nr:SRPBCC family protein [Gorillibacterium timonense]
MLAVVKQTEEGYVARFERRLKHSVEEVWSYLVDNDKLKQWFSELNVADLREGGVIRFDMGDGSFVEMDILALVPLSILEYTWGEDKVCFELIPESDGCRLFLIETMGTLTNHTPKDLAGWDVCLDVIAALLEGRTFEGRREKWEERYRDYSRLIESLRESHGHSPKERR